MGFWHAYMGIEGGSSAVVFAASSIYHGILLQVQVQLKALSLSQIVDENIEIAKVLNERETVFPGLPGILVLPIGNESIPPAGGTNERDDIGYPVGVVMFDSDRQDTRTGEPADAELGTQDQFYAFDRKLKWREDIRAEFIRQRLDISSQIAGADIWDCTVEPGAVVNSDDWLRDNIWMSVLVLRFWSRESRC